MRKWLNLVLLLAVLGIRAHAQDLERRFEQSYAVAPETVTVKVARGIVEVVNAPEGGELKFTVDLRVQDKSSNENRSLLERLTPDLLAPLKRDVESAFKSLAPRYKVDTKRVELSVRDSRPVVFDSDPTLQMVIAVRIEVPAGTKLEVRSVAAGVVVGDYRGSLDFRGEGGSFFVNSVQGDFSARTTSGSITVGQVSGRANLWTGSGSILAGKLLGPAKIFSSNGAIEIQQARDTLKVDGDDAEIILGLSMPLPKSIALATSAGSITLQMDRNLPLTVDAATRLLGKVRIRGLDPVVRRGSFNQSSLLADFNGGGEAVRLRTSWGNIVLVGREPLDG